MNRVLVFLLFTLLSYTASAQVERHCSLRLPQPAGVHGSGFSGDVKTQLADLGKIKLGFVCTRQADFGKRQPRVSNVPASVSRHHQLLQSLLRAAPQAKTKTTSGVTIERVVAQTTRNNTTGALNDSIALIYSPNMPSYYDYNTMIYAYNYPYSTSPMFNYAGIFTKPQVLFDTLRRWTVDPNTLLYGYYESDYAGHDVAHNTSTYRQLFRDSAIYPNRNFINRFTPAGNIDSAYGFNWIAGVSDSAFKQFFTYNSYSQITKDSTYEYHLGTWRVVSRTIYTYDLANNLAQIDNFANDTDTSFTAPLIENLRYINTYDGSHRLLTVSSSYYNGTSFGPYVIDTFGYTGAATWHSSWKEYQYDPINVYWAPMFYMTKHINLSSLPDTVWIKGFDSLLNAWVPQTMDVMHYNASHDPDTLKDFEYNFTAYPSTPDFTTVYYYQNYLNSLSAPQAPQPADAVLLYPNPVKDFCTITGLQAPAGSRITATVVNAAGQVVSCEGFSWQGSYQMATSHLTPGAYWVVLQDDKGNIYHRQAIAKQ